MRRQFELASGSVIGRDHRLAGRNNQDACFTFSTEELTIAVVCDGCGSGAHSEVGAQLGAQLTVQTLAQVLAQASTWDLAEEGLWDELQRSLLIQLQSYLKSLGPDWVQNLRDYFLFTIVGAVVTPEAGCGFSLGDGVMGINGQLQEMGPFPQNQPPYLAYGLLGELGASQRFQTQVQAISEVNAIVVGTDGVVELMQVASEQLPGKTERVGPISQFWQNDRYFTNSDQLRRRLSLINREVTQVDWTTQQLQKQPGWLRDDTTLAVIRRRPEPQ